MPPKNRGYVKIGRLPFLFFPSWPYYGSFTSASSEKRKTSCLPFPEKGKGLTAIQKTTRQKRQTTADLILTAPTRRFSTMMKANI